MISIYHWFGYKLKRDELFRMIRQAGFDGTTLWWGDMNYSDYRSHPEIARKAGLFIESVHAPYSTINSLWIDNLEGGALVENLLQSVADCAELDIPVMVMHLSSGDNPPPFSELGLDRIKRIVEKAEQYGVNVALENLRKDEYLAYALGNINSARLGFCYDSGHQHFRTPNKDLLPKYGSRLMALHLHDNDCTADQHLLPYDGTIDWNITMKKIAATGYKGAISLEVSNSGYEDLTPEKFLHTAYERAERLENIVGG